MKKRLLSAFLALAMVLTLLPMNVFAATTTYSDGGSNNVPAGTSISYCTATTPDQHVRQGDWYYNDKADASGNIAQHTFTQGFIASIGASGAWYASWADYAASGKTTVPSNFTLIGDMSLADAASAGLTLPTTMTVDVNGKIFTLGGYVDTVGTDGLSAMTSLKVSDSRHSGAARGSVTGMTTNRVSYDAKKTGGLSLDFKGINVSGSIEMNGRANTVKLDNVAVSSGITMVGTSTDSNSKLSYAKQTVTTTNGTTVAGAINISSSDNSTVSLTDTRSVTAVNVESDNGSVTVGGYSEITGAITVKNRSDVANAKIPSVTVTGGTVGGINDTGRTVNTTDTTSISISKTETAPINITGAITTAKGNVTVNGATTDDITVTAGSLTVSGSNNDIGDVTLVGSTGNVDLTISSTSSKFASITATNGANLNIKGWPVGRVNNYGTVNLTANYKGQGIKGGVFDVISFDTLGTNGDWFATDLQFIVKDKNGSTCSLYGKTELTQAISDTATTTGVPSGSIAVLGQAAGGQKIVLQFGNLPWADIIYANSTGIALPTKINNTAIANWFVGEDGTGAKFTAGVSQIIPYTTGQDLVLNSTNTAIDVTTITNVSIGSSTAVENKDIRVSLSGNNINLSGAIVPATGGIADIVLNLTTDTLDENGNYQELNGVLVNYDAVNKKVTFNPIQPSIVRKNGVTVSADGTALILNYGTGSRYTISANLAQSATKLELHKGSTEIQVTTGGNVARWTKIAQQQLIDQIEGGSFDWNTNKAMLEAINAAQATITNNSSIDTWISNAREYVWKNGWDSLSLDKHTGTYKTYAGTGDAITVANNFETAWLVPYLVVNVTDYADNGTMTATLTPYYRVDVSDSASYVPTAAYTVQAGKTLGALTGDMSNPIKVKFQITGSAAANFNKAYMHQNDTYVYQASAQEWTISKAPASGGLGTVKINKQDGAIYISESSIPTHTTLPAYKYDNLQAAVDDTWAGATVANDSALANLWEMDTITIDGSYTGSCAVNMTGQARKVRVVALGNQTVTSGHQNVDVQNLGGYTYIIQLKKDTAAAGTNIIVANANGGSASVSTKLASVGQTVTITLSPSNGYVSNGVTVKTDSGTSVSVSGSGNTYTFTMPSASSVTVTPAFRATTATTTTATVSVRGASSGSGAAVTNVGSNPVTPGTTVTVTTSPAAGQRTMGLSVTGATATRTGANSFQFTVPSGVSNVVVTPSFDVNNGTNFSDVWSSEYFSKSVKWAVDSGVTTGTSTYTFSPYNSCTRADMVTFLWRAAGSPIVTNVNNPFWDVVPGQYYYNAVLWAYSKGITNGVSANQFGVSQAVTRAQAVTFLYRYEGSPAASSNSGFYDVSSREYYAKAVAWANAKGVTNGTSTTAFSPNNYCQRGQIVTFLYRDKTGDIT